MKATASITLSQNTLVLARQKAKAEHRTLSALVEMALEKHFSDQTPSREGNKGRALEALAMTPSSARPARRKNVQPTPCGR